LRLEGSWGLSSRRSSPSGETRGGEPLREWCSAWRPSRSSSAPFCSLERPSGSWGASRRGSSRRAPQGPWYSAVRRPPRHEHCAPYQRHHGCRQQVGPLEHGPAGTPGPRPTAPPPASVRCCRRQYTGGRNKPPRATRVDSEDVGNRANNLMGSLLRGRIHKKVWPASLPETTTTSPLSFPDGGVETDGWIGGLTLALAEPSS
jgi:hypothetical protein